MSGPYAPVRHPNGQRAQVVSRPVRVDIRDFGASTTSADTSAQIQAALDSGAVEVTLGNAGTYRAAVTVPAGVTLLSEGARLKPVHPSIQSFVVQTGGDGASIKGIAFDAASDPGLISGERFVSIKHAGVRLTGCSFVATGFRNGIVVEGICDDGEISGSTFNTTAIGVLKSGTTGSAHRFRYISNRFKNIQRGDAIELNVGADVGFVVERNYIDGVTGNGLLNLGIGIGIAGGSYGGSEADQNRYFTVAYNWIRNTEGAGIHVEACARGQVVGNILLRDTGAPAGVGIEVFGSTRMRVASNHVTGFSVGIKSDLGVVSGGYVPSTDKMIITDNDVAECTTGISEGTAGYRTSAQVANNRISNCPTAIRLEGKTAWTVHGNTITDCPVPLSADLASVIKAAITPANHISKLSLSANLATAAGYPQATGATLTNTTGAVIRERGNSFATGIFSTRYDFHVPGDIVTDGPDQLLCTVAGWQRTNSSSYQVTATAGNSYVVVTSPAGDPASGWRVGQSIVIPGVGAAGASITAMIEAIYPVTGQYRLWIDQVIVTSTGSPVTIALAQSSAYTLVSYGPGSSQWLAEIGGNLNFAFLVPSAWDGASGLPTASTIRWPDGVGGVFSGTVDIGTGVYSDWSATWAGPTTKTVTVTGVGQDSRGNPTGPTSITVT